jgi:putative DNA primase/helicase
MKEAKKAFHEQVAENLIEQLKKGVAPWQKPWEPGDLLAALPVNPTTGKCYRGINSLNLMSLAYTDPRWLTYKQAINIGAQVRKGEKSTLVQYWKFTDERIKTDDDNNPVLNSEGQPIKEQVSLSAPGCSMPPYLMLNKWIICQNSVLKRLTGIHWSVLSTYYKHPMP